MAKGAPKSKGNAPDKARYGQFVVYPDSAPEDWWGILKRSHGPFARSPLHEPDEECKKPHYHVIYMHGNTVTLAGMKRAIPSEVPANGYVEFCVHPRGCQRYLLHLDDPDKQQWASENPRDLIETCNGFPLDLSREYSKEERMQQRIDVFAIIRDNDLCEYSDLLEVLLDHGMFDLFDYAFNHTIAMNAYLTSRRNRWRSEPAEEEPAEEEPEE